VYGKTGTTDEARNAWFVGCTYEPYYLCMATWMGYEDNESMHDIAGQQGLIYGGTLPAKIFARTFEILRQIQADRKARLSGKPVASAKPSATSSTSSTTRRRRRFTPAPVPGATARATTAATAAPTTAPRPSPSPRPILPSQGAGTGPGNGGPGATGPPAAAGAPAAGPSG
jgi:membrane peptidoglycan carboxypeptidase